MYRWFWKVREIIFFLRANYFMGHFEIFCGGQDFFDPLNCPERIEWQFRGQESATPQLAESRSRYVESGSRYSNFFKFIIELQNFKQLNQPFKGPIQQNISQGCNELSPLIYLKLWKKLYLKAVLTTPRLGESGSRLSITIISANSKPKSERLER